MHTATDTDLRRPAHAGTFFDADEDLVAEVAAYAAAGLAGDEAVIVVATLAHAEAVEARPVRRGIDLAEARTSGRYVVLDAAETLDLLEVDGALDAPRFTTLGDALLAEAGAGGRPVRIFGEMVALLWARGAVAEAIRLERLWNELASVRNFSLLCAYPVSSFLDACELPDAARICAEHSHLRPMRGAPAFVARPERDDELTMTFLPFATASRTARHAVAATLDGWGASELGPDASVIVSELVMNAVLHTRSPFRLSMRRSEMTVHIAVQDVSPTLPTPSHSNIGGRGLVLIDGLSTRWGTTSLTVGKVVWSEVGPGRH